MGIIDDLFPVSSPSERWAPKRKENPGLPGPPPPEVEEDQQQQTSLEGDEGAVDFLVDNEDQEE